MQCIAKKVTKNWSWISNAHNANKARILILWDSDLLFVQLISSSNQFITCKIESKDGRLSCLISVVYAFNDMTGRKELWQDLIAFKQQVNGPWIIGGDFNTVVKNDEKIGGTILSDSDFEDFQNFISACQLYTSSQVEYLVPNCSDHSPALITIGQEDFRGKRPFKYFKMWSTHPDFLQAVKNIWEQDINGYQMYKLHTKLKKLKHVLKDLNKRNFMNISEQVLRAKEDLNVIQHQLNSDLFNPELISREKDCLVKYVRLVNCETSFYRQKANIKWGIHGDKCTQYFHSIMKAKRHQNRVLSLYTEDGIGLTDMNEIIAEFIGYYEKLLGTAVPVAKPDYQVISNGPILSTNQSVSLSLPVTRDEIKQAIFSMSDDKAPGPDGYSASFFKAAWDIINEDFFLAVEEFFYSGKMLGTLNTTSITLVPKIPNPKSPSDFRPISCCNCVYKVITKIIANRIQKVMGVLISDAQSAFVKGRAISNNILLAHELIKHYGRRQSSPIAILNIDLRKAFDTINWEFIKDMLKGLGFPDIMIGWIMECISTPKFSLSINGSLHGFFNGARGLRQGDPLSPYLFVLGMELNITHLFFADDLLLFGKADMGSIARLYSCLQEFSSVSGLETNPNKCSVYISGVDEDLKAQICSYLNFSEGMLPVRYLGRLQLIKSVILGIHVFWTSIYILPTRDKAHGGLGVYSASTWSYAAAAKLLWMIHLKKDLLWIKWVHEYYMRHTNIWQVRARVHDSWAWKQLTKARDMMLNKFGSISRLQNVISSCSLNDRVKISSIYRVLQHSNPIAEWCNTIWDGLQIPKHSFILWLVAQSRLLTQDRLCRMGIISSNQCALCSNNLETCSHLFFECQYSATVWNLVMDWLKFNWKSCNWDSIINWFSHSLKRKRNFTEKLKRMALAVSVYMLWSERNLRIFQEKARQPDILFRAIKITIYSKILNENFPLHIRDRIREI
ncbi:uncharacterized protein LOC109838703 [Asparagus officinalis]|uniref:uncharacterized protein LOC109838703 n=1 Tax=Asparagus officinalis TaxID=4686 RepID=UPI00098E0A35|nr:uncharacterized protein LOC109838703 [Asparagus officinalis]